MDSSHGLFSGHSSHEREAGTMQGRALEDREE